MVKNSTTQSYRSKIEELDRIWAKGTDVNSFYPDPEVIRQELEVYNKWREEQTRK